MPTTITSNVSDITVPMTSAMIGQPQDFTLSNFKGKTVVLYFYPKDNTPGCTNEAMAFRDMHDKFLIQNTLIFGVSRDSLKSHDNFKAKLELPFELISDTEEKLCSQFDVIKQKMMYGKQVRGIERSTFVIDGEGNLRNEWRKVKVADHVEDVLEAIKQLHSSVSHR